MDKHKLTQGFIKNLQPRDKQYDVKDTEQPHLLVRINPSGRKTFCYWRRVQGKLKRRTIGKWPEFTVGAARNEVQKLNGRVASGEALEPETLNILTVDTLFNRYLEEHAKKNKKSWYSDQRNFERYCINLKDARADKIERSDIRDLHNDLAEKRGIYTANRTLALLRKMYNWAIENEILSSNPAWYVKAKKEETRERFLSPDELKSFFNALNQTKHWDWRDFFLILIFTGQRRANVQAMRWQDIDWQNAVWHIPGTATKNNKPYAVPLMDDVVQLLQKRYEGAQTDWVFPANSKTGHVQEPKKAWAAICKTAALKNLRIHDLRRTLGSWQAATGASLQMIGKSLGHQSVQATQIYSRLQIEPVREAMNKAIDAMKNT